MPALPWEDLDVYLSDFAFMATVGKSGATFPVILEEQAMSHDLGTYDLNIAAPTVTAKESDVKDLVKNDTLTIGGVKYWLTESPHLDGTGFAIVELGRSMGNRA